MRRATVFLGFLAPLLLVLGWATPVHAGESRRVTVTIALTPRSPSALGRLALARGLDRAQRRQAVGRLAPPSNSRAAVTGWLQTHDFRVARSDAWSVQATGPVAAARLLASARSPLRGYVLGVLGLDNRPVWRHAAGRAAAYVSPDFRHAYDATDSTKGSGATVATVEFSGWHQQDLNTYAAAQQLPTPSVTPVAVDGANPAVPGRNQGDFEVTLDQEALLAAAPNAAQRIYFGPNNDQGAYDTWLRIADDVANNHLAITAVSTSWGNCEQFLQQANVRDGSSAATTITAIETQLARLDALGVTVFAASGDLSAYDCGGQASQLAVDFPASSPHVVAVGGTSLRGADPNWSETAWGARTIDGVAGDGSGGGISATFARPDWQRGVGAGLPNRRLVPDISGAADPVHGLPIYWSNDPDYGTDLGWSLGGGTSLAAPLQAGLFASTLSQIDAAAGVSPVAGIGDIHPALYADPTAIRDVTGGTNHAYAAGAGYDLVTGLGSPLWGPLNTRLTNVNLVLPRATRASRVSIDAVLPAGASATGTTWASGTGSVACSDATADSPPPVALTDATTVVGVAAQTATGCLQTTQVVARDTADPTGYAHSWVAGTRLGISWGGHDPAPSSGLASFRLQVVRSSDGHVVFRTYQTAPGWTRLTVPASAGYRLLVTAYDNAANASAVAKSGITWLPADDRAMSRTAAWSRIRSGSAFGGSYLRTSRAGSRVGVAVTARRVVFYVHKDKRSGYADLYVDGRRVRRLNLYSAQSRFMVPLTVGAFHRAGRHRYSLHVLGTHSARAAASSVGVDAYLAR